LFNRDNTRKPHRKDPHPLSQLGAGQFARRTGVGFAITVALAFIITVVSVFALRSVIQTNDLVAFNHAQDLFDVERLRTKAQEQVAIGRGFLVTRDGLFTEDARLANSELQQILTRISQHVATEEERVALERVRNAGRIHEESLEEAYRMARDKRTRLRKVGRFFNEDTMPKFDDWERALTAFAKIKAGQLEGARWEARAAGNRALRFIVIIAAGALLLALMLGFILTRTLKHLYDEVGIAVRAREDVLAIVSHDLRNPLSAVMLGSAMIIKNPEMAPDARTKLVRTIQTSANSMKQLIEDLLDFVKVEFGRMSVNKKLEDPQAILSELHSMFTPMALEKEIQLVKSVDKTVTGVECERLRLVQILSNLVGNAIKFTPKGGHVSVNVTTVDEETLFWVRDSGPGIPPEQLTRVFDRYWQHQQASRDGVGLGLAIAKGLVEAHGGRIWAESQPGDGSTFFFTLPVPGYKARAEHLTSVVEGLRTATAVLKLPVRASAASAKKPE
jgi:signal transduction histidine kinase